MLNVPVGRVPTIKVLPNKDSAKILKHPNGPVLGDGALWPNDSFTARRLTDKSIKRAPADTGAENAVT